MPDTIERLFVFAEVAIALAGFASLVSAFERGGADPLALDANRLRNLVEISLIVVLFALFPLLPEGFGLSPAATWRVSSAAFLGASLVFMSAARRRQRALRRERIPIRRPWAIGLWTLAMGILVFLGAAVLGWGASDPDGRGGAALYGAALFLALAVACAMFSLIVASALKPFRDSGVGRPEPPS